MIRSTRSLFAMVAVALLAIVYTAPALSGPVYECPNANGTTTYTDQACAHGEQIGEADNPYLSKGNLSVYHNEAPSADLLAYGREQAAAQRARVQAMNQRRAQLQDQRRREQIRERRHVELVQAIRAPSNIYVRPSPRYVANYGAVKPSRSYGDGR